MGAIVGGTYAGVTSYNDGARGWELVSWTALGTVGAIGLTSVGALAASGAIIINMKTNNLIHYVINIS